MALVIGVAQPQSLREAEATLEVVKAGLPTPRYPHIFLHNFGIALLMFIPGLGVPLALLSMYTTGTVVGAVGVVNSLPKELLVLGLLLTPFFWLELTAYSVASTQSLYLLVSLWKRRLRHEFVSLIGALALVTGLLFAGALIEDLMISYRLTNFV